MESAEAAPPPIVIFTAGDPYNVWAGVDYGAIARAFRDEIEADMASPSWSGPKRPVSLMPKLDDAVSFLDGTRGTLIFVSRWHLEIGLAQEVAVRHETSFKVRVWSVGTVPYDEAPDDLVLLRLRGMGPVRDFF